MPRNTSSRSRARPTMADVASAAGVSVATVSYVLSGPAERAARISADTASRIARVVEQIGYVPNQNARTLRLQRTNQVLFLGSRITSLYSQAMARTIEQGLSRHGLTLSVRFGTDAAAIRAAIGALEQDQADGLIVESSEEHVASLRGAAAKGHAIVAIGANMPEEAFDVISFADSPAIHDAMSHLVDRGHQRFLLLSSVVDAHEHRITVAHRQLMALGVPAEAITVLHCPHDRIAAHELARRLLPHQPGRLAIYAGSDVSAIGVLWACLSLRRHVPDDIAIIGHGDTPETRITSPSLTSLGPLNSDFSKAAELMVARLRNTSLAGRHIAEPFQLSIRDSS